MSLKNNNKVIYCLVGASGSGKTTLANHIKDLGIDEIVSHTTRKPRVGEVEGVSYYFIDEKTYDTLEKVETSGYAGSRYCVSTGELNNKFKNNNKLIVVVDRNGALQIKDNCSSLGIKVFIIYVKTDLETMEKRMLARGDSKENIKKRLDYAIEINEFDTENISDYIIDNRNNIEDSIEQFKVIIKSA